MEKLILGLCPYCGMGCRFYIKTLNGEPVEIEIYEGGVNEGKLCPKGLTALDFLRHNDRLTKPLKRTENGFEEISWEQAIKEIAEKILEIRDKYGPDALGFFSSARCSNEENYLLQKIARLLGTNNVDHCARLCHASTVAGLAQTVGAAAQSGSYDDIPKAKVLLIWGYNPAETHPVLMRYILRAKDNGAKIIVVDPRKTKTAWFADIHLPLKLGTDIALANAMMHVIIKERLYDKKFVFSRTKGFEKLIKVVEEYTPEYAEKITGIPAHLIREAAVTFATAGRGIIMWAMGITQHITGTGNVKALADLGLICGYVGKEGTGLFPMRGQNNVQGACDVGCLVNVYPGYQKVTEEDKRDNVEEGFPTGFHFSALNESFQGKIYAFKKGSSKKYRKGEGILFTSSGQTHGYIPQSFYTRTRVGMSYLADSLLVIVECDQISRRAREILFMNSRDRLSEGKLRREIESNLEENLGLVNADKIYQL